MSNIVTLCRKQVMENTVIQLSAGELAEYCFPEGSLGAMPSIDRMLQGTAAHKKLQNIYSENENIRYQREVPLENVVEYDGFSLKIQGNRPATIYCEAENRTASSLRL